jgi:hypothetical protein
MPFDSAGSWIRSIPEGGASAICGYRADTEDLVLITYENSSPDQKLQAYQAGQNFYRPLLPGEHEIHSSGLAQTYYSARPTLEQRGGAIRSWLDQERAESGAKAPIHTRQLWEHKSNNVGDEEKFGAVRRPLNFLLNNPASAILALSPYSANWHFYPYPDFTTPGGVPGFTNIAQAAAATAGETAAELLGEFKPRLFAKEYLKVIANPLYIKIPAMLNAKLIDIREGMVFDDDGLQVIGMQGAYLRARYAYSTPIGDQPTKFGISGIPVALATTIDIDEVGNIDWMLSAAAKSGWMVTIPTGGIKFTSLQDQSYTTALNFNVITGMNTSVTAGIDIDFTALLGSTAFATLIGDWSNTALLGSVNTLAPAGNVDFKCGLNFAVTAGVKASITAPLVDIGILPTSEAVLGTQLRAWLQILIAALLAGKPTGNAGFPVVFASDPMLLAALTNLNTQLSADVGAPVITSKTVKVSP